MSTLAYGVISVGWAAVTFLSPASQLAVAGLLSVRAAHARWCGWSMSGQSQEILSRLCRPAAACVAGQYGSSVWSEESAPTAATPCSWAVTGYTPNVLIPSALTWNEALQETVAPGATLVATMNGSPAGVRP